VDRNRENLGKFNFMLELVDRNRENKSVALSAYAFQLTSLITTCVHGCMA